MTNKAASIHTHFRVSCRPLTSASKEPLEPQYYIRQCHHSDYKLDKLISFWLDSVPYLTILPAWRCRDLLRWRWRSVWRCRLVKRRRRFVIRFGRVRRGFVIRFGWVRRGFVIRRRRVRRRIVWGRWIRRRVVWGGWIWRRIIWRRVDVWRRVFFWGRFTKFEFLAFHHLSSEIMAPHLLALPSFHMGRRGQCPN